MNNYFTDFQASSEHTAFPIMYDKTSHEKKNNIQSKSLNIHVQQTRLNIIYILVPYIFLSLY